MNILRLLVFCVFTILENVSVTDGQLCGSANYVLVEDYRRTTMAVYDHNVDIPLCDDWIDEDQWYRFLSNSGEKVVERAASDSVPVNLCGTEAPIYIRGLNSHPTVDSQTVDATICANFGGNPCNWMETIRIHRCPVQGNENAYFLYQLKAPPGCSLSYCVGERPPCDRGRYWNGFFCDIFFPPMSGFPLFSGPHTKGSGFTSEVYFTCMVQYTRRSNDTNSRFRVTFLFDGRIMERVNIMAGSTGRFERLPSFYLTAESSRTQIVLGENYLRGRLGREISCKADSYWEGQEPDSGPGNSTMLSRTKFYAALESEHSTYVLNPAQGAAHIIVFRSTLPFTCRHCSADKCCNFVFRMKSEAATRSCSIRWSRGNTMTALVYMLPGLSQGLVSYGMTFSPFRDDLLYNSSSLWRDYLIPPVMVEAVSASISYLVCYSVTDPNIYSFDRASFSNMQVGDFYLVKTTQSMEIQVRQEVCSAGSCNCGVIVREGNSAFKISICEKGPWNATVQRSPSVVRLLSQNPVDSSTVYRDGTGSTFSIRMPSGLRVEIYSSMPWFNIHVYLPPEYHGKTGSDSMCGNSNGNRGDDVTTPITFRIPDDKNYFKVQPQCSSVFNAAAAKCDCANSTTFKCSNSDKLLQMVSKPQDPLPERWNTGNVCRKNASNRGKRSYRETREISEAVEADTDDDAEEGEADDNPVISSDFLIDPEEAYPPYSYDLNFGVNFSISWPTTKGKTEQAVTHYCENMVNSSLVYKDCNASVDVESIIRTCKTDIQLVDEWLPGGPYTSVFEENCVNELAAIANSSASDASADADSNSIISILTSVYEKTCPNQCNDHGTCVEAHCVCNHGYIGADCGIQENQPPTLTSIIRNGLCDVRLRHCDVISVFGSGIVPTAALKCRFTDQSTGSSVETKGTFITSGEYSCPVPGTTTHRRRRAVTAKTTAISKQEVSVTMNEVVYSNSLPFVLFDSTCMQCDNSKTCTQRSDACAIDGQCFANAAINVHNRCLQCIPERSNSSWTDATVVEDWKPCARQCDYGVRSRDTLCGGTLESREVELCKVTDCQENKDEDHQGVGFTFSEEDAVKILTEPDKFFISIADALNSYCAANAIKCCQSVGISTTSISSTSYTSTNLTTFSVGYPMLVDSDPHVRVKIVVKIDENGLRADCTETAALSSSIVYAQPKLLYDAVSAAKNDLERELGVTINSVWSPEIASTGSASPVTVTSQSAVTPENASPKLITTIIRTQDPVTNHSIAPAPLTPKLITKQTVTPKTSTTEPATSKPVDPQSMTPERRNEASTFSATFPLLFPILGAYVLFRGF